MSAITSDVPTDVESVISAARGPYPRLTPAAVERAKTKLGTSEINALGAKLGFSEMTFYRLRVGLFDIRYSDALRVAAELNWPVARCFDNLGGRNA